jgi:RHS repeat-associated protein
LTVSGTWQTIEDLGVKPYGGFDFLVDNEGELQWIIASQQGDSSDSLLYTSRGEVTAGSDEPGEQNEADPTIAVEPGGTLGAVWESQGRLFLALHHPITKHYYANGRLIATRHNDELYYVQADPLGSTTLFTDQGGDAVGTLRYEPLGAVISNTLPARLNRSLVSQLEANTGLQYDGQRYYDPWVGGYIQPNPFGGATGFGQTGLPGLPGSTPYTPIRSAIGSNRVDWLSNPLVAFGLNKALISTGLEEPWPEGLLKSRLARHAAPLLQRYIPNATLGFGRQFVSEFRTIGTVAGISLDAPIEFERRILALHLGILPERALVNTPDGFRVIANRYDRALNVGRLARNVPLEGPLFLLDAGLNAYFQYQAEFDVPGGISGLRGQRAIAGGVGNAGVSAVVTLTGAAVIAQYGLCAETLGATCVTAGLTILAADFLANSAFDKWGKEPFLDFFGLGAREFDE